MTTFRKNLRWALPTALLAAGLALAILAIPALRAQGTQQPMPMQGQQMHHGMMGSDHPMDGQMSDQMKARHDQMMQEMKEHMARMDELMATMNQATGQAKVDAMAAVLNEMWSQHKEMMEHMGMMGGQGMMGDQPEPTEPSDDSPPPRR